MKCFDLHAPVQERPFTCLNKVIEPPLVSVSQVRGDDSSATLRPSTSSLCQPKVDCALSFQPVMTPRSFIETKASVAASMIDRVLASLSLSCFSARVRCRSAAISKTSAAVTARTSTIEMITTADRSVETPARACSKGTPMLTVQPRERTGANASSCGPLGPWVSTTPDFPSNAAWICGSDRWDTRAVGAAPGSATATDHFINEASTEIDVHPCTGQAAELTIVQSGVIHFAAFADGTVHFTGTLRGTFSADALPTDGIADATGSFVVWFGGNGLLLEEGGAVGKGVGSFTLNGKGTNADGSRFNFHQNAHTVFDTDGVPKLDFFKARCA
jgi:hypothetical protein